MPKLLDEPTQQQLYGILTVGCPLQTAGHYTGCTLADIQYTAKRNKTFAANLRQSQARTELTHLKNIGTLLSRGLVLRPDLPGCESRRHVSSVDPVYLAPHACALTEFRTATHRFPPVPGGIGHPTQSAEAGLRTAPHFVSQSPVMAFVKWERLPSSLDPRATR